MLQHLGDKAHTTLSCYQSKEKRKCTKIKTEEKEKVVSELLQPPGLATTRYALHMLSILTRDH